MIDTLKNQDEIAEHTPEEVGIKAVKVVAEKRGSAFNKLGQICVSLKPSRKSTALILGRCEMSCVPVTKVND